MRYQMRDIFPNPTYNLLLFVLVPNTDDFFYFFPIFCLSLLYCSSCMLLSLLRCKCLLVEKYLASPQATLVQLYHLPASIPTRAQPALHPKARYCKIELLDLFRDVVCSYGFYIHHCSIVWMLL